MAGERRFELVRELGAGTFGTVYLAYLISSSDFRKKVALKLLNMQWDQSGDAGRRLRDEARLLGLLRHRAIVAVDDLVLLDGRWAVVMEHIGGADLERVLEALWKMGTPFPPAAAMEVVSAVAGALDAAYNGAPEGGTPLRVIHRDIKPSNVRLTPDGDVKVLDFGIARADFTGREAKTEEIRYGSLGYMAPERVLGADDGPSGDIYALGCVLVELLRGKAFGRSGLLPEQQAAQVETVVSEVSPRLGPSGAPVLQLLQDLLAYDPEARPRAGDIAERSRKIARGLGGEDLAEFARRFLPTVTPLLGDESKEASGLFTEQSSPMDRDARTLSLHLDDPPVAPSRPMTDPIPSSPISEPTVPLPKRGEPWLTVAIGAAVVLALGVGLWALQGTPPAAVPGLAVIEPAPKPALEAPPVAPTVAPAHPPESAPARAPDASPRLRAAARSEAPRSQAPSPAAPVALPTAADPPPSVGATLRAIKFAATDASSISAVCGNVHNAGTTSVLLRDVPAGSCAVTATIGGTTYQTRMEVTAPTGFICAVEEGALACR